MMWRQHLLERVEAYCAVSGLAESTVSHRLFGDGCTVQRIRSGMVLGVERWLSAHQWFDRHWPEGHRDRDPGGYETLLRQAS